MKHQKHRVEVSSFALLSALLLLAGCQSPGHDAANPTGLDPGTKVEVLERDDSRKGAQLRGRTGELIRNISKKECAWIPRELKKGESVTEFLGPTYGCVSEAGVAVLLEGDDAFIEIPKTAVKWKEKSSAAK
jgi:hypothetical protein